MASTATTRAARRSPSTRRPAIPCARRSARPLARRGGRLARLARRRAALDGRCGCSNSTASCCSPATAGSPSRAASQSSRRDVRELLSAAALASTPTSRSRMRGSPALTGRESHSGARSRTSLSSGDHAQSGAQALILGAAASFWIVSARRRQLSARGRLEPRERRDRLSLPGTRIRLSLLNVLNGTRRHPVRLRVATERRGVGWRRRCPLSSGRAAPGSGVGRLQVRSPALK